MYEFTPLFIYKFQFMVELLIAEGLVVYRLKRKNAFVLRLLVSLVLCFGIVFAIPIIAYNGFFNSALFIILFLISVVFLKVCINESWGMIFFCAIAGYSMQHIAYEVFDFIIILVNGLPSKNYGEFFESGNSVLINGSIFLSHPFFIVYYFFVFAVIYFWDCVFISQKMPPENDYRQRNLELVVVVLIIIFSDIVFTSFVTFYSADNYDRGYLILLYLYNIFCCLISIYIQFTFSLRRKLETEYQTVNMLWQQKREQYEITKENIDFINLKCHDLKHQIRTIGQKSSVDGDTIKEIEDVVSIYDSMVKTENEAIDIILTEKSLLCNHNDIRFSCIVDGKSLSFMSNADLYSLFGNMIDNAIEAVKNLPKEQRTIGLSVKKVNSLLCINIHNYFAGELKFNGLLPISTKKDKANHGFGMKSIQMICDKYGGEMSISTKDNIFNLSIIFASKSGKAAAGNE